MEKLNAKMRFLFEAIAAFYDEIDTITSKEGRPYCSEYGKMALRYVVRLYLTEVRGRGKAKLQTFEEYRKVSSQSTCYVWMVCAALFGYGELAPKNVFDWLFTEPKILLASSDHCRLMDDIVTHQFERERGHIASSVECYMMQYGVSREEAVNALKEMVEEDWKIVNQELLHPSPCNITHVVPHKEVLSMFLGFEKVMDVLYKYSDAYTNSTDGTKDMLTALLVTPLPISS
ncbi:unnamed protein product [Linum tenue]|uniref:Terpene synthase metal-binding domain-containing protein n=1 Tax=Linum tenue TaxID=586396 RepID=A0AAV0P2Z4_9ROSI|nr:unnamed protein product [Linum tenue]